MHTPCRLRITLTTDRQVPKWFRSRGRCTHQVNNFCGAPLSNKPPWLPPLSSVILLGNSTTPLAVLHSARPDIIEPACHCPICRYSIIEQSCLGCRQSFVNQVTLGRTFFLFPPKNCSQKSGAIFQVNLYVFVMHTEIPNDTHKLHHVKRLAVFQDKLFAIPYGRMNHFHRHWNKRMLTIM